jgi:hypothetical protein
LQLPFASPTEYGLGRSGGRRPSRRNAECDGAFRVGVPSGRAVNPVTGTNWEGTGVRPDVPADAAAALRTAHLRALERLLKDEHDVEHRARLQRAIDEVQRAPTTS